MTLTSEKKSRKSSEDTLTTLLQIELKRLELAVKFEEQKKIVFPETTQIVRDILKIEDRIRVDKAKSESVQIKKESFFPEIISNATYYG